MKPNFKQEAYSSFILWFDHKMCERAESFVNKYNETLYKYTDERLYEDMICFGAETKTWNADSSVTGAEVAGNATIFTDQGDQIDQFDVVIDYENSRVILYVDENGHMTDEDGVPVVNGSNNPIILNDINTLTISAVSTKELNVYVSNDTADDLIIEKMESARDDVDEYPDDSVPTPVKPYDDAIPCAYISNPRGENVPYALGGEDQYQMVFRAVVMTKNTYELDVTLGTFEDLVRTCIPALSFDDIPFDEYGDIMFNYDYKNLESIKETNMFVEAVYSSKMKDVVRKKVAPSFYVGFLDFEVTISRFPRA